MQKEAEKNKLENTLNNNLIRRRDELTQALQEISVEDRKRELDNCKSELKTVEGKIKSLDKSTGGAEKKFLDLQGKVGFKEIVFPVELFINCVKFPS